MAEDDLDPVRLEHKFDIAKEEQRKRGWYLAWHCRHQDCDTRGDLTMPSRGRAYELLALLDDGHRELTDGSPFGAVVHEQTGLKGTSKDEGQERSEEPVDG